jgi:hypothetical protein
MPKYKQIDKSSFTGLESITLDLNFRNKSSYLRFLINLFKHQTSNINYPSTLVKIGRN